MASIVLGIGTSHSPMLSTTLAEWPVHSRRDPTNPHVPDYEGLKQRNAERMVVELTPEVWAKRHQATQTAITTLGDRIRAAAPDVLVVIGDDEHEWFTADEMPALAVYWGESVETWPRQFEKLPPALQAGYSGWFGNGTNETLPIAGDLAKHTVQSLIQDGFDPTHVRVQPEGKGLGHAWTFVHHRLLQDQPIPMVPVILNTYFPPNQPTPRRCYDLGKALRRAIESWDSDLRVAVMASGGLSHFVVDEEVDRQLLEGLRTKNEALLTSLPVERLNAGTSEIRNWVAAGGALEHLDVDYCEYVPCYRTEAGTGCAMGFVAWS
jgi:aromatic ring-opening dioxygenase catalytic subunit (LigB family)